jgi:hypothetical protein
MASAAKRASKIVPDLRPIPGRTPARIDHGMLPPRFYAHVRDKILQAHVQRKLTVAPSSE